MGYNLSNKEGAADKCGPGGKISFVMQKIRV